MASGYHVGRGLRIVAADEGGAELEGNCRLSPGRIIVLFGSRPGSATGRGLLVTSWRLVRVGSNGPFYRGRGEWRDITQEPATPPSSAPPGPASSWSIRGWQRS